MTKTTDTIRRHTHALEDLYENEKLADAIVRWSGFKPVVWREGKWLLEGFVTAFMKDWEMLRAVDPSLPPSLPQKCFDVEWVAKVFGLNPADFAGYDSSTQIKLTDLERDILKVLAAGPKTGGRIADALGRVDEDGHFKGVLQGLRRRGLLGNKRPGGFFLTSKVRTDMLNSDQ